MADDEENSKDEEKDIRMEDDADKDANQMDENQDDDRTERQELKPITEAEQKELSYNLGKLGDKWKLMAKKFGFEKDEVI